ncbi:MAG: hypothetical protein JXJ04_13090 [Spirochaetales bacterium]|nr:hypothetical protein [Spirochaetales bacterium]
MKKKSKKKYAPGELTKTRKNIGDISEDEAKKMAKKLGGEIGVEVDSEDITHKYKKLKDRSYQRVILRNNIKGRIKQTKSEKEEKKAKSSSANLQKNKDGDKKEQSPSFIDRIRLDFLCSKPEYQLKTPSSALSSIFSIIIPVPDNIHPDFIKKARTRFYTALYDFVTAIRALYSKKNPEAYALISENLFFSRILTVIRNWDLSSIDVELSILRRRSRHLNVKKLRKLCRLVYYPMGILYDLSDDIHIKEAINWAYGINITSIEKKGGITQQIKNFYADALKHLPTVFNTVKKMFYPLLLKMVTKKYYFYEDFLIQERDNILNFLGIPLDNVIKPEKIEIQQKIAEDNKKAKENKEKKEKEEQEELKKDNTAFKEGVKLLEYLFPKAGWGKLEHFPDLYPYFQPLFRFPPGFEIIPKEDPLHQIFVLIAIIGYLLYGFRHIEFLSIRTERLELQSIKTKIDSFLSLWPSYLNNIIGNLYITRLQDYCRNIEKDFSYAKSEVASKIELELNHLKKMFFLPYQKIQFKQKISLSIKKNIPKLYFVISEILPVLEKVTREINSKIREKRTRELKGEQIKFSQLDCESVKNPWNRMVFDLENPLSKRLNNLLYKQVKDDTGRIRVVDRRSNANLLIYTYSLLSMLDYCINTKSSHFYDSPQTCIFRSLGNDGRTPQYSVPLIDSDKYLRETVGTDFKKDTEKAGQKKEILPATEFRSVDNLNDELTGEIDKTALTNSVFSIILLHIIPLQGAGSKKIEGSTIAAFMGVVQRIVRHLLDIPFRYEDDDFLVLLKNKDLQGAINTVRRIAGDLKKREGFNQKNYRLSAGVILYQQTWKYDKYIKLLNKMKFVLKQQKLSRIIFLGENNSSLKAVKLE